MKLTEPLERRPGPSPDLWSGAARPSKTENGVGPRGGSGAGRDEKPGPVGPGVRATGGNGGRVGSGQPGATPTGKRERRPHGATQCSGSPGQRANEDSVRRVSVNGDVTWQRAPGNRWTGPHAASPAAPSGTTGDVNRSSERLTPAGRSVVLDIRNQRVGGRGDCGEASGSDPGWSGL
jgi:hypothetical protein